MGSFIYGGMSFDTEKQAARAYAATALPDTDVIPVGEDAAKAAQELEAFWTSEVKQSQGLDVPEGLTEDVWRALCREALEARILDSRAS